MKGWNRIAGGALVAFVLLGGCDRGDEENLGERPQQRDEVGPQVPARPAPERAHSRLPPLASRGGA